MVKFYRGHKRAVLAIIILTTSLPKNIFSLGLYPIHIHTHSLPILKNHTKNKDLPVSW